MIVMPVPKDVREFQPTYIGPFSKRQFWSIAIAAGEFLIAVMIGKQIPPLADLLQGCAVIAAVIIVLCGFFDAYGMPFHVYMSDIILNRVIAPKIRPYQTENVYAGRAKQNRITYEYFDGDLNEYTEKQMKKKQKEKKKRLERFRQEHPEMRPIE